MTGEKTNLKYIEFNSNPPNVLSPEDLSKKALITSSFSWSEEKSEKYIKKGREENEYVEAYCVYVQDSLVLAAKRGDETLVRQLLSSPNTEVSTNKNTALWFACKQNNIDIAELLLSKGASPEYTLCNTPCIHLSALHASPSLISSLLRHQSNLELLRMRDSVRLEITPDRPLVKFPACALPVHMCAFGRVSSLSSLEALLPRSLSVDVGDARNRSPLIYAALGGNCFSTRALLQKGASIECRSLGGKTSLLYAARNGSNSVLELLIKSNAGLGVWDNENKGVFSHAKDEEVANRILRCSSSCREESAVQLLPIRELVTQGYHHTLQGILDSMVSTPQEDSVRIDLGQLELPPSDWERQDTLLDLISEQDPDLPLFDSLVLRSYAEHHMNRYGYAYLSVMMLELTIYLLVLSLALMLGVRDVDANKASTPLERFRLACEIYMFIRWGILFIFEIVEFGVIFKHKYIQFKRLDLTLKALHPSKNVLQQATYHALREYITDFSNTIDALVIFSALSYSILRVASLFVSVDSSISVFAVLVYFFSICIIFRYVVVIPGLGTYLQTLFLALKDSIWFMLVFLIPLFAFSGMFYISQRAPPYSTPNPNITGKYDRVRVRFDEEYFWILLTGVRMLIEQGAIIKFNYLEVYNWLMVIVFMGFSFVTLLVMRTLFTGRITSEYKRINQLASRYATYRTLGFLIRLHTKSIYSLCFLETYLQYYKKQIYLKKDQVRAKHPIEFQRLFGKKHQDKLDWKLDELRREVLERVESQESKLDEVIRLLQQGNRQMS